MTNEKKRRRPRVSEATRAEIRRLLLHGWYTRAEIRERTCVSLPTIRMIEQELRK